MSGKLICARRAAAALAVAGLTSLVLASAAGANHSVTDRVSIGPAGGNGAFGATSQGISQDGTHVFFHTNEQLVSADTDDCTDVYERVGGTTTLVSTGLPGPPFVGSFCSDLNAQFSGTSADGTRVFFTTEERFTTTPNHPADGEDTDDERDIYERSGGATTLIGRVGTFVPNGPYPMHFIRASEDGSRVFFRTAQSLAGGDSDGQEDIYEYSSGTTTRVSTGPTGGNSIPPLGGVPTFDAISADGTRAFFHTVEPLVADDTDGTTDVYERSGGTTTLVSPGVSGPTADGVSMGGISHDGTRVFFVTDGQLVGADTDAAEDVYERASGTTTLVSTRPGRRQRAPPMPGSAQLRRTVCARSSRPPSRWRLATATTCRTSTSASAEARRWSRRVLRRKRLQQRDARRRLGGRRARLLQRLTSRCRLRHGLDDGRLRARERRNDGHLHGLDGGNGAFAATSLLLPRRMARTSSSTRTSRL